MKGIHYEQTCLPIISARSDGHPACVVHSPAPWRATHDVRCLQAAQCKLTVYYQGRGSVCLSTDSIQKGWVYSFELDHVGSPSYLRQTMQGFKDCSSVSLLTWSASGELYLYWASLDLSLARDLSLWERLLYRELV